MKVTKFIFTFLLVILITSVSFGQTEEAKPSLDNGTLESQFDYLYRKSSSYQEYKVVKKTNYTKIKGNVLDSLKSIKNELDNTKQLVTNQANEINDLKANLKTTNDNLTGVTIEKDNIKFIGISLTKASYNSILWSIIVGLVLFLLLFIYKFKNSNSITKQANQLLSETEEEFIQFKTVALKREQKVRRELQDEINKQKTVSKKKKD